MRPEGSLCGIPAHLLKNALLQCFLNISTDDLDSIRLELSIDASTSEDDGLIHRVKCFCSSNRLRNASNRFILSFRLPTGSLTDLLQFFSEGQSISGRLLLENE